MADAELVLRARDETRAAFASASANLSGLRQSAESLRGAFASIAGVAGVGALVGLVKSTADLGDQLNKLSQKTGIGVEALSALRYAGELSDVSIDQLGLGLRGLAQSLDAGDKAFSRLGIAVRDNAGNLRDTEAVLGDIADAFAQMQDGAGKSALAAQLFGARVGDQLIPLLNQGRAGLAAAAEEARRFGVVISGDAAKASEQLNDDLRRLSVAFSGLGQSLAGPVIQGLAQVASGMAAAAREGGALAGVLRGIAELGKIALQGGLDSTALQQQRDYIQGIKGEISRLEKSVAGSGSLGSGLIDRLVYGDPAEKQRKLAELKITLADAERAFANLSKAKPPEVPKRPAPPPEAKPGEDIYAAGNERRARAGAQIVLDQLNELSRQAKELQRAEDEVRAFIEQDATAQLVREAGEAAAVAAENERRAEAILSRTPGARREAIYEDIKLLNARRDAGLISAQQLKEGYSVLANELEGIDRGMSKVSNDLAPFARDAISRMQEIQYAIQGVGNTFTESLVGAIKTGRLEIGKLLAAIAEDFARLAIRQSITGPLFNALAGGLQGGLGRLFGGSAPAGNGLPANSPSPVQTFGGFRAGGGDVSRGVGYVVGEHRRELFVPWTDGFIVPDGAQAAPPQITQIFNIAAGTDAGTVYRAAALGAAMAESNIARGMRIGAIG